MSVCACLCVCVCVCACVRACVRAYVCVRACVLIKNRIGLGLDGVLVALFLFCFIRWLAGFFRSSSSSKTYISGFLF